jgi:hypothetical protein
MPSSATTSAPAISPDLGDLEPIYDRAEHLATQLDRVPEGRPLDPFAAETAAKILREYASSLRFGSGDAAVLEAANNAIAQLNRSERGRTAARALRDLIEEKGGGGLDAQNWAALATLCKTAARYANAYAIAEALPRARR